MEAKGVKSPVGGDAEAFRKTKKSFSPSTEFFLIPCPNSLFTSTKL
jgi:hypothetical protein